MVWILHFNTSLIFFLFLSIPTSYCANISRINRQVSSATQTYNFIVLEPGETRHVSASAPNTFSSRHLNSTHGHRFRFVRGRAEPAAVIMVNCALNLQFSQPAPPLWSDMYPSPRKLRNWQMFPTFQLSIPVWSCRGRDHQTWPVCWKMILHRLNLARIWAGRKNREGKPQSTRESSLKGVELQAKYRFPIVQFN